MKCESCKREYEDWGCIDIYALHTNVGGLSVMDHKIHPDYVIVCDDCNFELRDQLKSEECWMDLDMLDNSRGMCYQFCDEEEFKDWMKLQKTKAKGK